MKVNPKNERIKRRFFRWLKGADGCCDSTVSAVEKAILLYEDFAKGEDFALFNPDKAIEFKEWLSLRTHKGKQLAPVTYSTYLRFLRKFFGWLCNESGYKSRVKINSVGFLRLTEKEERIAAQPSRRNYPSLEYVQKLADSVKVECEVDLRDRALIAFTLMSGMRDSAIASLPFGCFDEESRIITQNPRQGVQTKFSKNIQTSLIPFSDTLLTYFMEWVQHLKSKGFGIQDPLFPRTKLLQGQDNMSFDRGREVARVFWQAAGRIREIFRLRAKQAEQPYFPPHTFRHLAFDLALKACRTGDQIKAISQNFGHEYVATTFASYANYEPRRLAEVIQGITLSGDSKTAISEDIIQEVVQKLRLAR